MIAGRRAWLACALVALGLLPGCSTLRLVHPDHDLRPCSDTFAVTRDGWRLGIRLYPAFHRDPSKYPVVLCHGLGLNGTFWTLTDDHLPLQLAQRGYDVFVVDLRGSGASRRAGVCGRLNSLLRQTALIEFGEASWTVDDEAFQDVPAILDHVQMLTGAGKVNWIGHSLGGMLLFPYLECVPEASGRIATFVAMGSPVILASAPETKILKANRGLCKLLRFVSTSRIATPMMIARPPGLDQIDRLYYSAQNVDRRTVNRFYGFALEDPGPGAMRQLDHYLEHGEMVSADGRTNYATLLDRVVVPTLFVAGEGDVLAPLASVTATYDRVGSADKSLVRFGIEQGYAADYGHCDLVWSRHAPREVFPAIAEWLEPRQAADRAVRLSRSP